MSGVAAKALAKIDAGDLAILGSGVQAQTHLDAMAVARPLRRVRVWSRNPANVAEFIAQAKRRHAVPIEAALTAEAAVRGADLICTVTSAKTPVVERAWIAEGAHLNVVGRAWRPLARSTATPSPRRESIAIGRSPSWRRAVTS